MQPLRKIVEMNPQETCSGSLTSQKTNSHSPSPKATSSNFNDVNNQSKRLDLMFSRFAAFYGHVWRSQFKNEGFLEFAKKEWSEGLSQFSDAVVNTAVVNCRDFYEMPPTLPQVIQVCRQIRKRNEFYVASKPSMPATPEVVELHLKRCNEMLSNQQGEK